MKLHEGEYVLSADQVRQDGVKSLRIEALAQYIADGWTEEYVSDEWYMGADPNEYTQGVLPAARKQALEYLKVAGVI